MYGQPGAGPLTFKNGLREAREALGRVLLGTHVQPPTRSPIGISVATKSAVTAIVLAAAAALRFALGTHGIAFSSAIFFPAVLFCTLYAGWQYGLAAWIASTIIVWLMVRAGVARGDAGITVFAVSGAVQTAIAAFARAMLLDREIIRNRLLKLVDASQGFAFITDARGHPLEAHPRWIALTGMTWEDYRGLGWIDAIHPEDRNKFPLQGPPNEGKAYRLELRIREGATGDWRWHRLRTLPVRGPDGEIQEWIGTLDDIHEGKVETERREIVVSELRHRLKNLMAIVEALAKYSAPRPGTDAGVDGFLKRFTGRLRALTAASDLVLAGKHGAIEAGAVIRATLAPFMSDRAPRIIIEGPELLLSEELGGGLALAVHELATNAIKYGALSAPQGMVSFAWTTEQAPQGEHVAFDWKERGGPVPVKPSRDGFGMRMIRAVTAREKAGAVSIDYEPDGLRCRISFVAPPPKT
jgi:PAS domain S-box-containing protein